MEWYVRGQVVLISVALVGQLQTADARQQVSPPPALAHALWQVSLAVAGCVLLWQPHLSEEL